MAVIFIIFAALAFVHFIYDGILAPSMRMRMRFEIFEQRDKLRAIKSRHSNIIENEAFKYLDDSLNASIRLVSSISVVALARAAITLRHDQKLQADVSRRRIILDNCAVEEVKDIWSKTVGIVMRATLANSLGCLLICACLIVPIIAIYRCFQLIGNIVKEIVVMPERSLKQMDFDRLLPAETHGIGA